MGHINIMQFINCRFAKVLHLHNVGSQLVLGGLRSLSQRHKGEIALVLLGWTNQRAAGVPLRGAGGKGEGVHGREGRWDYAPHSCGQQKIYFLELCQLKIGNNVVTSFVEWIKLFLVCTTLSVKTL